MALDQEERFKVRYYLGFPDLASLPLATTEDDYELLLLQKSAELEVRLDNIGPYAEVKIVEILAQLDTAFGEFTSVSKTFPFKRIEDITFRDDEFSLRWTLNSGLINQLASILGIPIMNRLNPLSIGLAVV
jgi:hypothetical protein